MGFWLRVWVSKVWGSGFRQNMLGIVWKIFFKKKNIFQKFGVQGLGKTCWVLFGKYFLETKEIRKNDMNTLVCVVHVFVHGLVEGFRV